MRLKILVALGALAVVGGLVYLVVWVAMQPNGGCPKGQHLGVVAYMPMKVGSVIVMQPVFECESNR